jgi:hypothetical protein
MHLQLRPDPLAKSRPCYPVSNPAPRGGANTGYAAGISAMIVPMVETS